MTGCQRSTASRLRRAFLLFALAAIAAPLRLAFAHSFEPAVLDVREQRPGIFDVIWKLPGPESGSLAPGDPVPEPELPSHCRRVAGAAVPPRLGEPLSWRVDCGAAGLHGERLAVHELGLRVDVIVRVTWLNGEGTSGVLRNGAEELVLPASRTAAAVGNASARAVALAYTRIGIEHILFGADHLLFVLGLLLLVDSWRLLVKTISAFTVAHSVALALAVFGVVQVPPALVEALIALSIVLVAVELTRAHDREPSVTRRYPWAVAFTFGLLHGLGFAGALTQFGLPHDQLVLALLTFNLGVEIGQLLFVVVMLGPRAWLRRAAARWAPIQLVPAYAIGSLAVAWMLERIGRFWVPLS
jgi:hypothetical protein